MATVVSARPTTSDAYARALIERAGRDIDAERERLRQRLAAAAAPEQPVALPGASGRGALAPAAAARPRATGGRPAPADDGHVRVWELVAPKHDTVGLGHVAAPTGPTSYRMPGRRAAEMALARHRYDRGPAARRRRGPAAGVAFVRPAAFGVELNEEDSALRPTAGPAPFELRPAAPIKRRSSNKRVRRPSSSCCVLS